MHWIVGNEWGLSSNDVRADAENYIHKYRPSSRSRASIATTRVSELTYSYTVPAGTSCPGATAGLATDKRQTVTDNITGVLTSYCYDSVGRLTRVTVGSTVSSFTYDLDGNRTDTTIGGTGYNSANQPKAAGHTFDADGNQTGPSPYQTTSYNGAPGNPDTLSQRRPDLPCGS